MPSKEYRCINCGATEAAADIFGDGFRCSHVFDWVECTPKEDKVKHVKSQGQDRHHTCHWPGCGKQCPPAMWGCRSCWFKLPKSLRNKIWDTYRPGQEKDMNPSIEYLKVAEEVQQWIRENYNVD